MQEVIRKEELMLQISSDSHKPKKPDREQLEQSKNPDPPKNPKLTMKLLHELIKELQQENANLYQHINELEQQLNQFIQTQGAVAAAAEMSNLTDTVNRGGMEATPYPAIPKSILISRSERHPTPKRKSLGDLWDLLFRPSPQRHNRI
ncbi:hypothetical protein GC093_20050 [Paenibacillus sp. LMG 31456]|uniref:Uncharacterized protein n=1 Tax=Paenibacillus foliorum TaxID=2654974 RepID=A0A972GRN4_9BACL|nr:hypothetical protein [Paenibacillus foliorum]NOU95502.1 hypothetical protein [Paenibacillus foliorum]